MKSLKGKNEVKGTEKARKDALSNAVKTASKEYAEIKQGKGVKTKKKVEKVEKPEKKLFVKWKK